MLGVYNDCIKDSFEQYISSIVTPISSFSGFEFSGEYSIDDAYWLTVTQGLANITLWSEQCDRIHKLISFNKNIYNMGYKKDSDETNTYTGEENMITSIVSELYNIPPQTEFGGGVGAGYQVYCDEALIISSGGGSGGGAYYGEVGEDFTTFGNGGGGGIQIAPSLAQYSSDNQSQKEPGIEMYSLGGGGGCGTCTMLDHEENINNNDSTTTGNNTTTYVTCGSSADDNSISLQTLHKLLHTEYTTKYFQKHCEHIVIYGGGGGGAGISFPDHPTIGAGFGFQFKIQGYSSKTHENHHENYHENNNTKQVSTDREILTNIHRVEMKKKRKNKEDSQDPDGDIYRKFSELMQDSVQQCSGYGNWDCVCQITHDKLRYCDDLYLYNTTDYSYLQQYHTVPDCNVMLIMNTTIYNILSGSCTHSRSVKNTTVIVEPVEDQCPVNTTVVLQRSFALTSEQQLTVSYLDSTTVPFNRTVRMADVTLLMDELYGFSANIYDIQYSDELLLSTVTSSSSSGSIYMSASFLFITSSISIIAMFILAVYIFRFGSILRKRNEYKLLP